MTARAAITQAVLATFALLMAAWAGRGLAGIVATATYMSDHGVHTMYSDAPPHLAQGLVGVVALSLLSFVRRRPALLHALVHALVPVTIAAGFTFAGGAWQHVPDVSLALGSGAEPAATERVIVHGARYWIPASLCAYAVGAALLRVLLRRAASRLSASTLLEH